MNLRKSPKQLQARYEELCRYLQNFIRKNKKKGGMYEKCEYEFPLGQLRVWTDPYKRTVYQRVKGEQGNVNSEMIEDE